jgi:hypothetical protein
MSSVLRLNLSHIAKLRLQNQQILETKFTTAVELLSWLTAMQAQEYAQTKWAIGLRLPHLKDDHIESDFTSGKILRTHVLRPTWHFVTAEDIRWLLLLTAPRVHAANAFMYRKMELDESLLKRTNKIIIKVLEGGKQLTREVINAEFKKNKIEAEGHRLSYIMMYAELEGIICSGAREGNQFTYTLLDERAKFRNKLTKEEALVKLTDNYFLSRGPATLKDFSTWSGLTLTECKKGIAMTKLRSDKIEGEEYFLKDGTFSLKKTSSAIHLLPVYDEFIMGYKDREAIFKFRNKLKTNSSFTYDCMIISDGQVIGTWKRIPAKKSMAVEFDFFKSLTKIQSKAFDDAVNRLEVFTGLNIER